MMRRTRYMKAVPAAFTTDVDPHVGDRIDHAAYITVRGVPERYGNGCEMLFRCDPRQFRLAPHAPARPAFENLDPARVAIR